MKNILILEDNYDSSAMLAKIVKEIDSNLQIYQVDSLSDAYQVSVEHDISLFIVDIILNNKIRNDVSGLKFVEKIRKIEKYMFVPIIFVTSLADPMIQAYKNLHCFSYLEKPIHVVEAKNIISQALRYTLPEKKKENMYFRDNGIIYSVCVDDIIYLESHAGSVTIHSKKEDIKVYYRTCKDMLKEIDSQKFIKANRSIIVNKEYISNVDFVNRIITLIDDFGTVNLSLKMKKEFMVQMKND